MTAATVHTQIHTEAKKNIGSLSLSQLISPSSLAQRQREGRAARVQRHSTGHGDLALQLAAYDQGEGQVVPMAEALSVCAQGQGGSVTGSRVLIPTKVHRAASLCQKVQMHASLIPYLALSQAPFWALSGCPLVYRMLFPRSQSGTILFPPRAFGNVWKHFFFLLILILINIFIELREKE